MSLFQNMLPSLYEEIDSDSCDDTTAGINNEDNKYLSSPKQQPPKRRIITAEENSTMIVSTTAGNTNTSRPIELVEYIKYEEEIITLQDKFNTTYEKFIFTNGTAAYEDKTKVLNAIEKVIRFDLKKWEMDLLCLRIKQREILYPGVLDAEGIIDCKSFVDQKIKLSLLEAEIKQLKKTLKKCFCTNDKTKQERMELFISDLINL